MEIKEISIKNWRSINSVDIEFNRLMVLIGQNNHGKSNILSALLFFFGEQKSQELDFYNNTEELYVEVTFNALNEHDLRIFSKYVTSEGYIKVRKTAHFSGNFNYRGYIQNPQDEWLQESNAPAYTKREIVSTLPLSTYLPEKGRITKASIIDSQKQYISSNIDSIEFNYELETTDFLGSKNVAKGMFGKIYYIPAVKNATDDYMTKSTTVFGSLYSRIIEKMSASNTDWKQAKKDISNLFKLLNKTDSDGNENINRPEELSNFEEKLTSHLTAWDTSINVEILPPDIDDVFKTNTQIWVNDGVTTDIRRKGHGLQRALIFALIKTIAEIEKEERDALSIEELSSRKASSSMYFILEEPELYLHPQAQRSLFDSLITLTNSGNQVVLCTHSSAIVNLEYYKSICIVKKQSSSEGTKVCQCSEDLFESDQEKKFKLSSWINPDRSELFFAKKVLLVEGATERAIIPYLAEKLDVFKHEYTIIDCGSKTAIPIYSYLLNKFNIPYTAIYDIDHQEGKNESAIAAADRDTTLVLNAINDDIGNSIAFENDIEEELGFVSSSRNKPYKALEFINNENFSIPSSLRDKILSMYE